MHQEWLKWRSQGIGSSDAPVIMKTFAYGKTPRMLWDEKIKGTQTTETRAMRHGKDREEEALHWLEMKTGVSFDRQEQIEHFRHPWMRATLDGINRKEEIIAEIKCPYNLSNHQKNKDSGKLPEIYWPQIQHQLEVCGLHDALFLSYDHSNPENSLILEVKRDESYIEKLLEEEQKFWLDVTNLTPPPLTELDYEERDSHWANIARQKFSVSQKIKELEKEEESLYAQLIELSDGTSSRAEGILFTRYEEKGRTDYSALLKHAGISSDQMERFRKDPITKWRLSVK